VEELHGKMQEDGSRIELNWKKTCLLGCCGRS